MPIEGRPAVRFRKDLDTEQWRNTNDSYRKKLQPPTSGTQWDGKDYQTHKPMVVVAKDKRRHQRIHQKLPEMSEDHSGPTSTLEVIRIKWRTRPTMEINRCGLHYRPAKVRALWEHTGSHRSADVNEAFDYMYRRSIRAAVCQSLHEEDSHTAWTTTRYHYRQRGAIYVRLRERNNVEPRSRTDTQHGFLPRNIWRNRADQHHIRTILPAVHQLPIR